MPLNDRELLVVATKTMRLSEKEALDYLKEKGYEISKKTYYRILGRISSETRKRLFEICKNMMERHMDRIDDVELLRRLLLEILRDEKTKTADRIRAIHELRELEPWISAFDEAAQGVLEDFVKNFGKDPDDQVPSLSSLDGTESQND